MMARELMTQRLKDAGVDPKDSNTYFSFVRKVCNEAAKSLYKAGFDIADAQAFAKKIAEIASLTAADEINPTTQKAIEAVAKLVEFLLAVVCAPFRPGHDGQDGPRPRRCCAPHVRRRRCHDPHA